MAAFVAPQQPHAHFPRSEERYATHSQRYATPHRSELGMSIPGLIRNPGIPGLEITNPGISRDPGIELILADLA